MKGKISLMLLLLMIGGVTAYSADIGDYRIPSAVKCGGVSVEAGTYLFQIEEGAEGPYLQLSKGGSMVAKELAIMIPAKEPGKTAVQVASVQEFIRIRIRQGESWYYVYLPKA